MELTPAERDVMYRALRKATRTVGRDFLAERWLGDRHLVVQRFIFTAALLADVRIQGLIYDYSARYCYEREADALKALVTWDGQGDPPGPWVKEKISERLGPGADPRDFRWPVLSVDEGQ